MCLLLLTFLNLEQEVSLLAGRWIPAPADWQPTLRPRQFGGLHLSFRDYVSKSDYIASNDRVAVTDEAARMWKETVR
jgi:hypothetical protein